MITLGTPLQNVAYIGLKETWKATRRGVKHA